MTPELRAAIVAEARTWLETPYRHQAYLKGVSCDCWGLVRGVGEALSIINVDHRFARFRSYARLPNPKKMGEGLQTFLERIDGPDAGPGDVVWLAWRPEVPMHLGILAEHNGTPTLIHAEGVVGKVTELAISPALRELFHSFFRYPGSQQWSNSSPN